MILRTTSPTVGDVIRRIARERAERGRFLLFLLFQYHPHPLGLLRFQHGLELGRYRDPGGVLSDRLGTHKCPDGGAGTDDQGDAIIDDAREKDPSVVPRRVAKFGVEPLNSVDQGDNAGCHSSTSNGINRGEQN